MRWADYYPRRMLRLYVPVVGAVLLATMWAVVVPRPAPSSATSWVRSADEPSGIGIARDIALVWEPGSTTSVLWSLTWEVLFSLLLPIDLVVVAPSAGSTRAVVIGIVVSIAMSAVGEVYGVNALRFLPVFAIGCYLAVLDHRVWSAMASWWRGLPKWMRAIAFFLLIAGICSPYTMTGLGLDGPIARAVGRSAMLASCAVAVCFGVLWTVPRDSRLGSSLRWMGSRSFALYLVHEPIVVSAAILGAGRVSAWWSMPIAISVALVVTEVFYRVVERPSTAFARSFSLPGLRQVGGGSS